MEQKKNEQSLKELERLNKQIVRLEKLLIKSRGLEQEFKIMALESDQLFKTAADGLSVIDKDFNILRVNDAFLYLAGLPYDEVVGRKCYQVLGDSRCDTSNCSLIQIINGKGRVDCEVDKKIKEDKEIPCRIIATPYRKTSGELIGIVENIRDITDRKRIEGELKETRDYLNSLLQYANAPIVVWDVKQYITIFNTAFRKLTRYTTGEVIGQPLNMLFPEEEREESLGKIRRTLEGEYWESVEIPILCKDGSIKIALWNSANIYDKDDKTLLATIAQGQDITERKWVEKKLKASQRQLRNLSAHLESAREDERKNVAREIHDELGQTLTALKIDLSEIAIELPEESASMIEKTKSMSELIDITIQTVQRISSNLRPRMLDDLGLISALDWQASEFEKLAGIKCSLSCNPTNILIGHELSTAIFRIFQEALTNILRHAKATKVEARLEKSDNIIKLEITDNGVGITEEQISNSKGFGLVGMRERVRYHNGIFTVKCIPNKGTKIYLEIPVKG